MDWEWSDRLEEADWIASRQPPDVPVSTIPTGYAAYARLLHPIEPGTATSASSQVRWADVAAWGGTRLGTRTQFWQLALPEQLPAEPIPGGDAAASDTLGVRDGQALAGLLRAHTDTAQQCWFGIWSGYGWHRAAPVPYGDPVESPPQLSDPVPAAVRAGPMVRLPGRDYLLYAGPVEAGLFLPDARELADLWWPQDRAWFVYGDVDLNSTYVAGTDGLIDELLASTELEAVRVDPEDPVATWPGEFPVWLEDRVEAAISRLLEGQHAELHTSRFTATMRLAREHTGWWFSYRCDGPSRARGGNLLGETDLADGLRRAMTWLVADQVE
ncbi:MAG: hypothetical protein ACRDPB_03920 [Nocardioidaceae bacterium]